MRGNILLAEDDATSREMLVSLLQEDGYTVTAVDNGALVSSLLDAQNVDAVILDVRMPGQDGIAVLKELQRRENPPAALVTTAYGTSSIAIEAMTLGAYDYLTKPIRFEELSIQLFRAIESRRLALDLDAANERWESPPEPERLIGSSDCMQRIYKLIGQVATTDSTVLIQGESGTGKELVARAIHRHSHRATSPLVSVNCAALPETLLEAELFGYEKGAFTGAAARRRGRFEIANGGSLLLAEVSEIPMALQVKLLRVLHERTMERLGAEESIALDLRVMASTNRNLAECVAEGNFREDLFYRLNVVSINLPPLRSRREDIPELCEFLMRKLGARRRLTASRLTEDALQYLIGLDWPGNVRQLEHTLERALVLSRGTPIGKEYLKLDAAGDSDAVLNSLDLREGLHAWVGRLEKNLILRALEAAEGNRSRAASMLKINRRLLYDKLKEHDLET